MENIWFTSDNHFWHKNIKKFCPNTRKGNTVEEMNELMIRRWQAQVQPNDRVYMLGDVFFCRVEEAMKIIDRLPGQKFLCYGNHDSAIRGNATLRSKFVSVGEYREVDLPVPNRKVLGHDVDQWQTAPGHEFKQQLQKVVMFHYPVYEWNRMHHGSFHLFGHVHGGQKIDGRALDVGIDAELSTGDMSLYSWEQVYNHLIKKEVRGHHNRKMDL